MCSIVYDDAGKRAYAIPGSGNFKEQRKFFPRAWGVSLGNIADYAEASVESMRTITLQTNVSAMLALTAFFSDCAPNCASAANDVPIRTKPHVNVGAIVREPPEISFHPSAR